MRNAYITKTLFTLALFAAALTPAQAAFLDGNTVRVDFIYPNISTAQPGALQSIVGSGVEFTDAFGFGLLDINVLDRGLALTFRASTLLDATSFNGIRLTDILLSVGNFTQVNVNAATTLGGFGNSNVSFDNDNIFVNFAGLSTTQGNEIILDINPSAITPTAADLPEPATLFSAVTALGLFVLARRRS